MVRHVAPAAGRSAAHAVDDDGASRLRVLHVVMSAGPTNSQWNEHCLPSADERRISVCSLLPATVPDDPRIQRVEGDGTVLGCLRALDRALRRDVDVVHVHSQAGAAMLLTVLAARRIRPDRVVLTLHNSWSSFSWRNRLLSRVAVLVIPTVVSCGAAAAASLPVSLHRWSRGPVRVVANGVDTDRVDAVVEPLRRQPSTSGHRGGVRFVSVGRLITVKDPLTVVRAFAAMARPEDRLSLAGEGALREEVRRTAADLGVAEQVTMTGLLGREEVYRLLAGSDVFVSASHGEGLPVALLEAMAAGLPVVVTDIAPHREVLTDEHVLPAPGDVTGLAASMARLARMSPDEREAVGSRERAHVRRSFSLRAMADGYAAVYAEVVARAARSGGGSR